MTLPSAIPVEKQTIGPIDHVDLITVKLPFVSPFGTSVHVWTHKEVLLLRLQAGGVTAWSECVADPDPFYLSETTRTAAHLIRDFLLPCVEPTITLGEIGARFRAIRGNTMAKATIENALLCLLAERAGVPLHELLGLPPRRIMSGISIGLKDSPAELLASVEEAVGRGYHRVKMKIKKGKDVDWVRAVRDRYPDLRLMVDANCDYGMEDLERLLPLDTMSLMMIEQPLAYDDIYRHAAWQKEFRTPICLDESIMGLEDAAAAVDLGACRIINIKQGRVGGMLESLRIARYCAGRDIPVWSGGMDETGIGRALNIHLQAAPEFTLPGDTSETSRYFTEDIVEPSVVLDGDGFIAIPPGPGLGIRVLADRVIHYAIAWERII
jgi:o-succinylbenzoate synthase